jgi:alkanesulfonate monooxygenase SsuD/methylene tetrahydromethanopterin reductase-like flavin-dependent oxidoreductase (luciferase family)
VGLSWDERWKRLDEGVKALRALWSDDDPFVGKYYATEGIRLLPGVVQRPAPPIWIGSWGSDAGLRRVARLGDGWLASAYNTTPNEFAEALKRLSSLLTEAGKNAKTFPNALATMWFYITENRTERDRLIREVMMNTVSRPEEILRDRLLIGSAEDAAQKLSAFAAAGLKRVLIWPIGDYIKQIETFQSKVAPLVIAG